MRATLIIPFLYLLTACSPPAVSTDTKPKRVKVFTVGKLSAGQLRSISGRVVAADTSRLSFGISGTLTQLNVVPGESFEAGQVLATLDAEPFLLAAEQARAQLASARALFNEAEQSYRRTLNLDAQGASSQAEVDNVTAVYGTARANLAAEESNLARKERDVTLVQLTAPFSGQVTGRAVEAFEEVSASQEILTVQSEGAFEVSIAIPETLIRMVDYGQPVTVSFPSTKEQVAAAVSEIGARAESGNAYPVTVQLASNTADLRTGMTASVQFNFANTQDDTPVFLIPLSALALDVAILQEGEVSAERTPVFVVENETLLTRTISIGNVRGNELEVFDGLSPGDLLVSAGVPFLHEGMNVAVWTGDLVDG